MTLNNKDAILLKTIKKVVKKNKVSTLICDSCNIVISENLSGALKNIFLIESNQENLLSAINIGKRIDDKKNIKLIFGDYDIILSMLFKSEQIHKKENLLLCIDNPHNLFVNEIEKICQYGFNPIFYINNFRELDFVLIEKRLDCIFGEKKYEYIYDEKSKKSEVNYLFIKKANKKV